MVLVVGLMAVWAFAEKVATAMKTARQNKTTAEFTLTVDLLRANDARIAKGLTFWPSFPGTLGSWDLYWHSRRHHPKLLMAANVQHDFASGKRC